MDNNLINIITSQTMYTSEEAEIKLKENNNDYLKIIKEYHKIIEKDSNNEHVRSINQSIFKEFRNMLDTACKNHRIKNEEK